MPGERTAPRRGKNICAAPLVAGDTDPLRARRITDNLARLGLAADVKTSDCRKLDAWWDGRPFDRILADVPCSASGGERHADDRRAEVE